MNFLEEPARGRAAPKELPAAGEPRAALELPCHLAPPLGHPMTFMAGRFLIALPLLALFCWRRRIRPAWDRRTLGLSAVFAATMVGNLWLILKGLETTAASVFFPVLAGSAILFGVVWARLRGERPSRLAYLGAALAALAIVLINLKGG